MCLKRMIGGGWAQQLGWHTRPRHSAHLCRHFPRRLRRLSAASSRSRSTLRSRRRRCWLSTTERFLEEIACFSWGQVRGGEAGAQEPSAEGSRPARIRVTTRANNVADFRGASTAIIFTAFLLEPPQRGPRFRLNDLFIITRVLYYTELLLLILPCPANLYGYTRALL